VQQGHRGQLHEGSEGACVSPFGFGQIGQPSLIQADGRLKQRQWLEATSVDRRQ
jgi:hypothetical protein